MVWVFQTCLHLCKFWHWTLSCVGPGLKRCNVLSSTIFPIYLQCILTPGVSGIFSKYSLSKNVKIYDISTWFITQWTRVNLNSNRTDPCAGPCDVRQVPARPYPLQARFKLWWRGQTFYSTRPIIGLFYLPH